MHLFFFTFILRQIGKYDKTVTCDQNITHKVSQLLQKHSEQCPTATGVAVVKHALTLYDFGRSIFLDEMVVKDWKDFCGPVEYYLRQDSTFAHASLIIRPSDTILAKRLSAMRFHLRLVPPNTLYVQAPGEW